MGLIVIGIGLACCILYANFNKSISQKALKTNVREQFETIGKESDASLKNCQVLDIEKSDSVYYILAQATFEGKVEEEILSGLNGLYLFTSTVQGKKATTKLVKWSENSISSGYNVNGKIVNDKQVLFGDLKDTAYDEKTDSKQDVAYAEIVILSYDKELRRKDVSGKKGYVIPVSQDSQITAIELLDSEGHVLDTISGDDLSFDFQ